MAARALAAVAAARRAAGQSVFLPALASSRIGGARTAHSQAEEEHNADDHGAAEATFTGEQVEAALNRKNVEVLKGDEQSEAMPLPNDAEADVAWVPDQDTGVFVPAEEAAASADGPHEQHGGLPSVLDQAVFNREEDMEDVERPAAGMDDADGPAA